MKKENWLVISVTWIEKHIKGDLHSAVSKCRCIKLFHVFVMPPGFEPLQPLFKEDAQHSLKIIIIIIILNKKPFSAFSLRALSSSSSCFLAATVDTKQPAVMINRPLLHMDGRPVWGLRTVSVIVLFIPGANIRHAGGLLCEHKHMITKWTFISPCLHVKQWQQTINHRIFAGVINYEKMAHWKMNHEMDGIDCCCPIKSHKWNVHPQMRTVIAGLFGRVIDSTKVCKKVSL